MLNTNSPAFLLRKAVWLLTKFAVCQLKKALDILAYSPKAAAGLVKKVLESAIANAEHNEGADIDELKVARVFVDEGPTMKRIKPRAKGRADRIFKRTSHITVVVSDS